MSFQKLVSFFEETHITAILEASERLDEEVAYFIEYSFQTVNSPFGLLHREWLPVPYLSIIDNLLLGTSLKKKEAKPAVLETLAAVNLEEQILTKSLTELSSFEEIKLQLVHYLLLEKRAILIGDIFTYLSVQQIQELLPLLRHLAKHSHLAIVILTADTSIAHSPYMDKLICPLD
ncbi:hypothetical protein BAU15_07125 [Enterococcus sp. JM4C]|uniref:hypothetical protein n=1 Tax=Candidatus Enterococcus huntleyi TaxID=1857217 RepID=UPI00137AD1D7|nr:hypothetical protein [Enterococcus sp. JM4C]KAF1297480.1 hypothetical protein BAU15_07125 [Enterococcus sp. JM4C]